jgi:hypothetical protein
MNKDQRFITILSLILLVRFFLNLPQSQADKGSVLLRTEVSPQTAYIGDVIHYKIIITFTEPLVPQPLKLEKTMGEFEILNISSSKPKPSQKGKLSMTHDLNLVTFSTGPVLIPGIPILFSSADGTASEAKTEDITIQIKSLLQEKGDEGHLRSLKGLINFRSYTWIWIVLVGILLAFIIYFFINKIKRKNTLSDKTPALPTRPAEEIALEALQSLESDGLISLGQIKEFYDRLSFICREYLENRYNISALEKTSSELIQEFRQLNLPLEVLTLLRNLLDNADLAKFAKFTPPVEEISIDLENTRRLITITTPEKKVEEPKEVITV